MLFLRATLLCALFALLAFSCSDGEIAESDSLGADGASLAPTSDSGASNDRADGAANPRDADARPPSDFDLSAFTEVAALERLAYVPADLSGITYNHDSDSFFMIRNNATRIWEVDTSYNLIRTIVPTGSFGDSEDIVYLGNHEFAIVSEEGVLYIGTIAPGTADTTVNPATFQAITFSEPGGNQGPEGVAYDASSETFYVVKEENPRKLYSFARPAAGASSAKAIEPFDAQVLPMPRLTQDMSGVLFNAETGRLLILSHRDHRAIDIDLDATVFGILELPQAQHEGIAFDGNGNLHIVGEPNLYSVYERP